MKLAHPNLEKPIIFKEDTINVLVIENQEIFAKMIQELKGQIDGLEGGFIFSSDMKTIEIDKKMEIVINPFELDFNQKKIISKLYGRLKDIAVGSDFYLESSNLIGNIMQYIGSLSEEIDYPITYSLEADISSIFKVMEVKLETNFETLAEKIIDFLAVEQEFCGLICMVFVNLKSYLSEELLELFYQQISYQKLHVLLLESTIREKRFPQEEIRIIDIDLCEI